MGRYISTLIVGVWILIGSSAPVSADQGPVEVTFSESGITAEGNKGLVENENSLNRGTLVQVDSSSRIIVGEHDESSLQLLIRIDSKLAPEEYQFSLPSVASMVERDLGDSSIYQFFDTHGNSVGWLGRAWASDANGQAVPTEFSFANGILTQQVAHHRDSWNYPILADPYLGINLITSVKAIWESSSKSYRLSIDVSAWVWAQYAPMVLDFVWGWTRAYSTLVNYGWPEVLSNLGAKYGSQFRSYVTSNATYKDQFNCHAMGAPALFVGYLSGLDSRPTWDLEGFRRSEGNPVVWAVTWCGW